MESRENESGLVPCGHRIVVRMDEVERTTPSGIVVPDEVADREEMSGTRAIVIAVGPSAWGDQRISGQWAKPGDRVMIAKFAGQLWKRNGTKYRVINDLDVIAVIKED
jgi:chaperonin GroES